MKICIAPFDFELLSERAIFSPAFEALILSDVHLGKTSTFRHHGIPIPEGETHADLQRISLLLKKTKAKQLIIVGDLFHSAQSAEMYPIFEQWLEGVAAECTLIVGNHDQHFLRYYDKVKQSSVERECWTNKIALVSRLSLFIEKQFELCFLHDPSALGNRVDNQSKVLTICGHLHPTVSLKESPKSRLRLPCFLLRSDFLVLPAFGTFTRGKDLYSEERDRIFPVTTEKVFEVSGEF